MYLEVQEGESHTKNKVNRCLSMKKNCNKGGRGYGKEVVWGVEKEWSRFRESILEVGEEVCGTIRIREEMKRKWSEW